MSVTVLLSHSCMYEEVKDINKMREEVMLKSRNRREGEGRRRRKMRCTHKPRLQAKAQGNE